MSELKEMTEDLSKPMSRFEQLFQIVINPTKVFESIVKKPNIILPLVISLIAVGLQVFILRDVLSVETANQIKASMQMQQAALDPQQLNGIIDISIKSAMIMSILGAVLSPLVGGAISHFISMFMGGEGKIAESCSVTALGAIIGALGILVALPIAYLTKDYTFAFSASVFMEKNPFNPLYSLATFVNVFLIWQMVVTIMGFKKVHQFGMMKAAIAVLTPTIFLILMAVVPLLVMK